MTQTDLTPLLSLANGTHPTSAAANGGLLEELVRSARTHLGMEVGFISEFVNGSRVFRHVDAQGPAPVHIGDSDPLEASYCQRVVDGRLPELMVDACAVAEAASLSVTRELPVGAHLSIPLRMSDGSVYGTFCCFSRHADPSLTERDLAVVRMIANVAARYIEADVRAEREKAAVCDQIDAALTQPGKMFMVYQSVVRLADGAIVGVEALSRFQEGNRTPDLWFADAARLGRGAELEVHAVQLALNNLALLPAQAALSVNMSPAVATRRGQLEKAFGDVDLTRVVLEMTEHAPIPDYSHLNSVLLPFRERGLRLAVDDAGAGYASLRHILWLEPDWIKLDISITRDIDRDPARRALAVALISFGTEVGSLIVAEGVETEAEGATLQQLGAHAAQGYYFGRPSTIEHATGDHPDPLYRTTWLAAERAPLAG